MIVKLTPGTLAALDFHHHFTRPVGREKSNMEGQAPDPEEAAWTGVTWWHHQFGDYTALLHWEWVRLESGVIAQKNPLDVRSDFLLVDPEGQVLAETDFSRELARLVHRLPWRLHVEHTLSFLDRTLH